MSNSSDVKEKKSKKVLILSLVGITCIIWGLITMFISSVKKDQKEMNARMDTIIKKYDEFSKNIENFNKKRDEIHQGFLDNIYYETMEKSDTEYKNKLYDYEKLVSNISKNSKVLRNYCQEGIYYSSSDVNSKCIAFKQGYEEMVNSFVSDVDLYNDNIKKYNEWLATENKTDALKLESYETKKVYIDYNKDGKYSGKEEESNG